VKGNGEEVGKWGKGEVGKWDSGDRVCGGIMGERHECSDSVDCIAGENDWIGRRW